MEGLTQLCADGNRGTTNNKKKSKDKQKEKQKEKEKKRRRSVEGDNTPRSSTTSSRSFFHFDDSKPPKKQRKTDVVPVPVLKVHPSEFPVEIIGLANGDPSDPVDMSKIFTPDGAFDAGDSSSPGFALVSKTANKYQDILEVQVDSNFLMSCALCAEEESDERVCCSNCPRSFHKKCFVQSTSSIASHTNKPVCQLCEKDREIYPEDEIDESLVCNEKIKSAYAHLANTPNFVFCGVMLSQILEILEKLKAYDYGWVFAEPVNTDEVHDYLNVIKRPMDYSTISKRLELAEYGSESDQSPIHGLEGMDPIEAILLNVLCDVDQVHQVNVMELIFILCL